MSILIKKHGKGWAVIVPWKGESKIINTIDILPSKKEALKKAKLVEHTLRKAYKKLSQIRKEQLCLW